MSQGFKIRKNKSLKDMQCLTEHHPRANLPPSNQEKPTKKLALRHNSKGVILQPIHTQPQGQNPVKKGSEARLENTQPVHPSQSRKQCRYEQGEWGSPSGQQMGSLGKENRPASMNDIKYPKIHCTFYNTDKYESTKSFKPLHHKKSTAELRDLAGTKMLKDQSRTRMLRLAREGRAKEEQPAGSTDTNAMVKNFRKGILEHIFKKKLPSEANTETIEEVSLPAIAKQQAAKIETSPVLQKSSLFCANCSTIRQKSEQNSSFLSQQTIQEFIEPSSIDSETFWHQRQNERRKKIELQKIRHKFPQNFFK